MTIRTLLALLAVCTAWPLSAEADDLPTLRIRSEDKIVLSSGEELPGEVIKILENATVVFKSTGDKLPVRYQRDQYQRVVRAISAEEILRRRQEILLAEDAGDQSVELLRTIRWGAEQDDEGARAATLDLAAATVERYPDEVRIAEQAIELLRGDPARAEQVERVVRTALDANPTWADGYQILAELLLAADRNREVNELIEEWLERHPTSYQANLMKGRSAEAEGQLEQARQAYFKALTFHQDLDAGLGYARLSLVLGEIEDAGEAAAQLLEAGVHPGAARAIQGVVQVHHGADEAAIDQLQPVADDDALPSDIRELARYNLGLAHLRVGHREAAREVWRGVDLPAADLARAIVDREPVAVRSLPEGRMRRIGRELNACLALEDKNYQQALGDLDEGLSERQLFLTHVAQMLEASGTEESLAVLEQHEGAESLRWQVYGHILGQRFDRAQALLDRLPEDDGYAAACRVYVAQARGEEARAKQLYQNLGRMPGVPNDYLAKLADRFDAENDELRSYDFDWPEGFNLSEGWSARARGTGILIGIEDGRLVFKGTQTPSAHPVSRAWCLVSPDKLARVSVDLDIAGVESAVVGMELLDMEQANGLAYGVLSDGSLAWRQLADGEWGEWNRLDRKIQGRRVGLALSYDHRFARILAEFGEDRHQAIGDEVRLASDYLCATIFGTAEAGTEWTLRGEGMELQIKPRPTVGGGARRNDDPRGVR